MGIAFAICRTAKIKSLSALKAHAGHAARTQETPNANPALTPLNPVLVGSGDPTADALARLSILPKPPRKNGVLAIEVLLTASPEYFRPNNPEEAGTFDPERVDAFIKKAVPWVQTFFGHSNVTSILGHYDESTFHLTVTAVPLDDTPRKKGCRIRLNAARWLDGKKKLQAMQDSFADAMKPLGLERGIRGSQARHQAVKKYYGQMKELPSLKIKYSAALDVIQESNNLNHEAYRQGRIDQASKDFGMISTLRKRVRSLLKGLKLMRRAQHPGGAVGFLERGLDNAVGKTISSNVANDIGEK